MITMIGDDFDDNHSNTSDVVTAKLVKTLKDKTKEPMMKCARALKETNGDIDKSIKWLNNN